ncbi:predicted protein [Uncinocarpus reesii 1704]|uniref:proline--tRNA ligase n=1 Tax=Uncinocarpus reesii (strain UAMH 1704) TaxID=336963 RepID=C4JTZ7_UNCRE|nr:uncharacterized protein UREG_05936 [Uncinocarpus reesii 1704]EEP81094.1 predicted protein [Uncinocarpus reesii 1704]
MESGIKQDTRNRLSTFWVPTGGVAEKSKKKDGNELLVRAGFIRQAYSGIFHLLPLGLRVQQKLENLIDKHMQSIGASKLSLSSLSSQELWKRSGRLNDDSEIFRFNDRKGASFLLAPTHEEEITALVGSLVKSYRDLPLRVYQITRKYRDEPRPRQGLLRGREFLMKDLYTFDYSAEKGLDTYNTVKEVYTRIFDDLRLPYLVAAADSGNMGGDLSHEFHFENPNGEDTVITCTNCSHAFNEEIADGRGPKVENRQEPEHSEPFGPSPPPAISTGEWVTISRDKSMLVRAYYPKYLFDEGISEPVERQINSHALQSVARAYGAELDLGVKNPLEAWKIQANCPEPGDRNLRVLDVYDFRVRPFDKPPLNELLDSETAERAKVQFRSLHCYPGTTDSLDLLRVASGDKCSRCGEGVLHPHTTIELGHTFHLGTRYSSALQANVAVDPTKLIGGKGPEGASSVLVPLEMGCHGIGVSRMISAVATMLADHKGLKWPQVIAPFSAVICFGKGFEQDAEQVYDALVSGQMSPIDAVLDDRSHTFPWKLKDADLIGFPVILVLGKQWRSSKLVEVQCRQLDNFKDDVPLNELPSVVSSLLAKL